MANQIDDADVENILSILGPHPGSMSAQEIGQMACFLAAVHAA